MPYCTKCGAFVEEGAACSCQQNQQQAPNQYAPPQSDQYNQPPPQGNFNQSPPQGNFDQPPQYQYRQPQGQYNQPQQYQYGQPQNQYGQPPEQYGQPQNQYGQPPDQYGQPQNQYGQPPEQYGQPPDQYSQPQNQYGQPQNQYNQPPNQYGQLPNQPWQQDRYQQIKPPGMTMIKVTGILMTIFGAIALVLSIAAVGALSWLGGSVTALLYFELIATIAYVAFGIMGIVMCGNREKGSLIMTLGIIILLYKIIDLIWAIAVFGPDIGSSTVFGAIFGFILPILYIVGGNTRKKADF